MFEFSKLVRGSETKLVSNAAEQDNIVGESMRDRYTLDSGQRGLTKRHRYMRHSSSYAGFNETFYSSHFDSHRPKAENKQVLVTPNKTRTKEIVQYTNEMLGEKEKKGKLDNAATTDSGSPGVALSSNNLALLDARKPRAKLVAYIEKLERNTDALRAEVKELKAENKRQFTKLKYLSSANIWEEKLKLVQHEKLTLQSAVSKNKTVIHQLKSNMPALTDEHSSELKTVSENISEKIRPMDEI